MIKVNLLKTRVTRVDNDFDQSTLAGTSFDFNEEVVRSGGDSGAAINFLVILFPVLLLYLYESHSVGLIEDQLKAANQQFATLNTQVANKTQQAQQAQKAQDRIRELESKVEAIKTLTKSRLAELKALDFLQSIIPDRVWLESIDYADNKFVFRGFAVADEDLTDFLKRLESRSFYTNVILLQATESQTDQGNVKAFEISSDLVIGEQ